MKKNLNCKIAISLIIFLLLICLIICSSVFKEKPEEEKAVDYIMDNISEFESDFSDMGYKVKLAYTQDDLSCDLQTKSDKDNEKAKSGCRGDGILILYNDNEQFHFDIGFDYYELSISDKDFLSIEKRQQNFFSKLNKNISLYPFIVGLRKSDETGKLMFITYNTYDINFVNYYTGNDVFSKRDKSDKWIKTYYSSDELRGISEDCIALEDKLIELYQNHSRQS